MTAHDPEHYKVGGIESIDVIRAKLSPEAYRGFCLGNAMKYVHRAGHKDAAVDDAKKAIVYLEWFAESLEPASPVHNPPRGLPKGWTGSISSSKGGYAFRCADAKPLIAHPISISADTWEELVAKAERRETKILEEHQREEDK